MNRRTGGVYGGSSHNRFNYVQGDQNSTTHKLKTAYYTTKQAVIKKLGGKEDEHLVASDAELDAKLELFKSIQKTCLDLLRITDRYQERICALSQAENEMGRFLKSRSPQDKTQAGKIMGAVGKSLSFSAQQRLALRVPLTRLQQEVDTFRNRAVVDTLITIQRMEAARTEYRGALLWMKNASEELDPDTYKQMEKFRKVQTQVRNTKSVFDKYKVDCMQKVDLLSASRCNMFSHVLSTYQETLLRFWEKTSRTMGTVSDTFRGYQYYDFAMLKDLAPESRKLAENSTKGEDSETTPSKFNAEELDKKLEEIFTDDYKDEPGEDISAALASAQDQVSKGLTQRASEKKTFPDLMSSEFTAADESESTRFLDDFLSLGGENSAKGSAGEFLFDDSNDSFVKEWSNVFGQIGTDPMKNLTHTGQMSQQQGEAADLFEGGSELQIDWFGSATSQNNMTGGSDLLDWTGSSNSESLMGPLHSLSLDQSLGQAKGVPFTSPPTYNAHMRQQAPAASASNKGPIPSSNKMKQTADTNRWLNLFADLDPLGNPDKISKKEGQIMDA